MFNTLNLVILYNFNLKFETFRYPNSVVVNRLLPLRKTENFHPPPPPTKLENGFDLANKFYDLSAIKILRRVKRDNRLLWILWGEGDGVNVLNFCHLFGGGNFQHDL